MSAIDDKYISLGGPGGFLGRPVDEGAGDQEMDTADGRGRVKDFEGGSIYWSAPTGAFEVHGGIRIKWAGLGGVRSFLGFPTTDETVTPDGRGRFNHFEGGSIYWTPETDAHEVHGLFEKNGPAWVGSAATWGIRSAMRRARRMDADASASLRAGISSGRPKEE